ncbi:hypothetical protein CLOM_g1543 [Closterium sp. NIES-68]|nr:hypothetical protein CLOM_g1543 [Closterium sp. NIES-68]GJP85935.1 hypothetical protein CLOP_g16025 [Closterium sp. NIES-67]
MVYDRASDRELSPIEGYPGILVKALRPTSMIFRFSAGFIEPAHHHTLTHDVYLISGRQIVQNVTKGTTLEVNAGDFLSTPGGDVHRVLYLTDAELFAKFDGTDDMALPEKNKLEIVETVEQAREALGDWNQRIGEK